MSRTATVRIVLQPTAPSRTTTQNDNGRAAVDTEAPAILPQQPRDFWSTVIGANTFFVIMFFAASWGIVGPAMFLGLAFGWPNCAPVASIIAAVVWWGSYPVFLSRRYYPGRPFKAVLDEEGHPITQEAGGVEWIWSVRESGLLRWERRWVPRSEYPTAEEGAEEQ